MRLTGVTVHTESEVTAIDAQAKTVTVHGEQVSYDSLVIAAGAEPVVPPVPGTELNWRIYRACSRRAINMRSYVENCKRQL